ncbi:GNAT family N-acetyltransferase [Vibrio owensii]|uniref:GNAT family N-acetyltransferase n=1 Tax=Vibrio owensii TaxID=696485 RepID=UPI003AB039D6
MNKIVFRNCSENDRYWIALEKLFQSEWSDFLFSDTYKPDSQLPQVLAVLRGNVVIGGLAFSHFQEPHGDSEVVWVNAVYVSPEYRGQGIASELINRGVNQASEIGQDHLYAYTNVPLLYQSLGWSVVDMESEPNHNVMKVRIKNPPRV